MAEVVFVSINRRLYESWFSVEIIMKVMLEEIEIPMYVM